MIREQLAITFESTASNLAECGQLIEVYYPGAFCDKAAALASGDGCLLWHFTVFYLT